MPGDTDRLGTVMKIRIPIRVGLLILSTLITTSPAWSQSLTLADVNQIVSQAASYAAAYSPNSVIAVVDEEGRVLVVHSVNGSQPSAAAIGNAVSKAGTAAFLDSFQDALTSRAAGFLLQENYPPGVRNRPAGPLFGVGFSSLPHSDVNFFRTVASPPVIQGGATPVLNTSLSGFPGGVPLYKNGQIAGGIGVFGDGTDTVSPESIAQSDVDEEVALAGQQGFEPSTFIRADRVYIDGISVPYVRSELRSFGIVTPTPGAAAAGFAAAASPGPSGYLATQLGGVSGQIRSFNGGVFQFQADTTSGLPASMALTRSEVTRIITAAAQRASITRAKIRIPRGSAAAVYIAVVNNPVNADLSPRDATPTILGIFKMQGAVEFSYDISVQKARTCIVFSDNALAMSTRALGFISQPFFPPGINGNPPGLYNGLQSAGFSNPASATAPQAISPNGITIFPGGVPLYRNGQLIGAIGVSGDGVEEDDIIASGGAAALQDNSSSNFTPPKAIRSDRYAYRGVRLPFVKFPRDPVR